MAVGTEYERRVGIVAVKGNADGVVQVGDGEAARGRPADVGRRGPARRETYVVEIEGVGSRGGKAGNESLIGKRMSEFEGPHRSVREHHLLIGGAFEFQDPVHHHRYAAAREGA